MKEFDFLKLEPYFKETGKFVSKWKNYYYSFVDDRGFHCFASISVPIDAYADLNWSFTRYESYEFQNDIYKIEETPIWFQELINRTKEITFLRDRFDKIFIELENKKY